MSSLKFQKDSFLSLKLTKWEHFYFFAQFHWNSTNTTLDGATSTVWTQNSNRPCQGIVLGPTEAGRPKKGHLRSEACFMGGCLSREGSLKVYWQCTWKLLLAENIFGLNWQKCKVLGSYIDEIKIPQNFGHCWKNQKVVLLLIKSESIH